MAVESTCVLQDYFDQIDKVESNCSTPRKYSHKWSEFLRFNLYFAMSIVGFSCLFFATLR